MDGPRPMTAHLEKQFKQTTQLIVILQIQAKIFGDKSQHHRPQTTSSIYIIEAST